ncbi:hypothetical protein [Paenibacillus sp. DMB20]|nr:hypothetical protein [Paenibacillus sp. DMB20]
MAEYVAINIGRSGCPIRKKPIIMTAVWATVTIETTEYEIWMMAE